MTYTAACIQINSKNSLSDNIQKSCFLIEQAASAGADFITLPENVAMMAANKEELIASALSPDIHPALVAFKKIAKKTSTWLLVGSVAVDIVGSTKIANRSFLIDSYGSVVATYDKIHLYDASVQGGESHQESKRYQAGDQAIIANLPWNKIGLTICYDLRFPYLYRSLAKAGATLITVPSAFTKYTGKPHWQTLLKARAIENSCYIVAPAQTGIHPANRETYGHSLIIDPWGQVLADAGQEEGFITATIDTEKVTRIRSELPSLQHDRKFDI